MSALETTLEPAAEQKFVRGLGLLDSTMLVAGSMIGSGIFIVSSIIARQVGAPGWLLVVWLVTGLLTLMAALSYGELAAMMPKAGGQYVYLREAFSPLWGFRSEEHTSELQSHSDLVCRLLLEKKNHVMRATTYTKAR